MSIGGQQDHARTPAHVRAHARRSSRACASPCSDDFSGWNWTPNTDAAADDRGEPLAVLGGADDVGRIRRSRRVRVHVVEGAARSGQPGESAATSARSGPRSSRCAGSAARRRRSARDLAGDQAEPGGAARARPSARTAAASRGRCRAPACPARPAPGSARPGRARARLRIAVRKRPDAGHAPARRRPAARSWSRVIDTPAPTCSSAFSTERRLPIP